ncbi:MAG: type II secretion system F family protein [Candidatus Omnitrophota bacterium]
MDLLISMSVFVGVGVAVWLLMPAALKGYQKRQEKQLEKITKEMPRTFVREQKKKLLNLYTITPLLVSLIAFVIFKSLLATLGGFVVGIILPTTITKQRLAKRRLKFSQQLVDAMNVISGSLKAGLSLIQSIETLVSEMPAPISEEFGLVLRENQMGIPLEESLYNLKKRMLSDELDLLVTAILVSRETGGDLTQVLSQLCFTIREREKLKNRVRVLCTQGRLQGWIMAFIPTAFGAFIYMQNPHAFDVMLQDKMGQMLLGWAVISQILGIYFIRKLSKVDI